MATLKEILGLIPWGWIVAFVLGWLAIRRFSPSVQGFLQRTHKVTAGTFIAEAAPSQQIVAETKEAAEHSPLGLNAAGTYEEIQEAIQPFRFPTMLSLSKEIREKIDAAHLTPDQLMGILADGGGVAAMAIAFENTYSLIFGSQIKALQDLNAVPGRRAVEVKSFYDEATKTATEFYANYPFDSWLEFLKSSGLINREGDVVNITEKGRDFLKYLVQTGKAMVKPG